MFDYTLKPRTTSDPVLSPSSSAAVNRMTGRIPDAVPHRSFSQIKKYAACPLQWRLSREYEPAFTPAGLVFGSGFHAAVEAFYRARMAGRVTGLDELLNAFALHWAKETSAGKPPVRFTAKLENADGMLDLAARMLAVFLASVRSGEVVAVEEPFAVTIAPDLPSVVGRMDLVEVRQDDDGIHRLHLVDLKTATRRPTVDALDADQLLLYALAAEQAGWAESLGLPLALRFDVVTKKATTPEFVCVPVTATRHDSTRLVEKIRQIDHAMRSGVCYPAPSWACASCGYTASQCTEWPELPAVGAA